MRYSVLGEASAPLPDAGLQLEALHHFPSGGRLKSYSGASAAAFVWTDHQPTAFHEYTLHGKPPFDEACLPDHKPPKDKTGCFDGPPVYVHGKPPYDLACEPGNKIPEGHHGCWDPAIGPPPPPEEELKFDPMDVTYPENLQLASLHLVQKHLEPPLQLTPELKDTAAAVETAGRLLQSWVKRRQKLAEVILPFGKTIEHCHHELVSPAARQKQAEGDHEAEADATDDLEHAQFSSPDSLLQISGTGAFFSGPSKELAKRATSYVESVRPTHVRSGAVGFCETLPVPFITARQRHRGAFLASVDMLLLPPSRLHSA